MIELYQKIEAAWFHIHKKIRFLLVGGFNTLLSYLLFIFFIKICNFPYQLSLIIQYFITVNLSIFTMRYFVFQSRGKPIGEYFKACGVYLLMLGFNYVFLFCLIDLMEINVILSQGIYIIISTIITYLLHQNITFKNKA